MPVKPASPDEFDAAIIAQLACPACHGDLRLEDSHLTCSTCARRYPIVDDIPALIIQRAKSVPPVS